MSGIFSKLWPGFALAIILGLVFLLCQKSCKKPDAVDTTAQKIAAEKVGYDSAAFIMGEQIKKLNSERDSFSDIVDSLEARTAIMQYTLDSMGGVVKSTMVHLDLAKVIHDTVLVLQDCDSLEAQVKRGLPAVSGFEEISDSVIRAAMSQAIVQDSMIEKLARLNQVASATITAQQLQYQILHKDDASKTAQLRIFKPVAIGGAAIIALEIVLKILLK